MSSNGKFDFTIEPKPSFAKVDITQSHFADFAFTVTNKSERPVRAEAMIIPLAGPTDADGNGLPPEEWGHWLELQDEATYDFGPSSVKNYTVRVVLPADVRFGEYKFRLIMVNVADPDGPFAQSDVAVFNAVGPHFKVASFVWWALAAFVALTLLTVLIIVLLQSRTLTVILEAPTAPVSAGAAAPYRVLIENRRPVTATDVMLLYRPPVGVVGAVASVADATVQQCDELGESTLELIRCDLGTLAPGSSPITIVLSVIPGPGVTVITNTATVTVLATLDGETTTAPATFDREQTALAITPPAPTPGAVVLIDPSAGIATLDEPISYRLLAWTTGVTATSQLTLTYQLPAAMRYAASSQGIALPEGCTRPHDYFTLVCQRSYDPVEGKPAEVIVKVTPTEVLDRAPTHKVSVQGDVTVNGAITLAEVNTPLTNSALFFNGRDAYVELGYKAVPATGNLTAEMWVHPFTADDGQSFLGAHRPPNDRLNNTFLLGYWNNGLHVNIGSVNHTITATEQITQMKQTKRYHLAVTVKRSADNKSSDVAVYLDGQPQRWCKPTATNDCPFTKVFTTTLGTEPTLFWLLGQEWDSGNPQPRPSDFFKGTMSDVRLWDCVRNAAQIAKTMNQHLVGDETGLQYCDEDEAGQLIGYWPLTPSAATADRISDRGLHQYDGKRVNAIWGEPLARFGGALQFDGIRDQITATLPASLTTLVSGTDIMQITIAGWVKVDAIPTKQQWVAGLTSEVTQQPALTQQTQTIVDTVQTLSDQYAPFTQLRETMNRPELTPQVEQLLRTMQTLDEQYAQIEQLSDRLALSAVTPAVQTALTNLQTTLSGQPEFSYNQYQELANSVNDPTVGFAFVPVIQTQLQFAETVLTTQSTRLQQAITDLATSLETAATPPAFWVALLIDADGHMMAVARTGTTDSKLQWHKDEKPITAGAWVHYAGVLRVGTVDGTPVIRSLELYRDSALVKGTGNEPRTPVFQCPSAIYISGLCAEAPTDFFRGDLDEVRIWTRALAASEISQWLKRPGESFDEALYLPFDDGPGAKTNDLSPNQQTIPLDGPAWIASNVDNATGQ